MKMSPRNVFCELYRVLTPAVRERPSVEAQADVIDYLSNGLDADVVYRGA